jgi:5-methylcytosine-specific restriction protein A
VHVRCHADKTKIDVREIAKTKRIHAKHIGAFRSQSRPLPGSKRSGWKHLFNGKWERRT